MNIVFYLNGEEFGVETASDRRVVDLLREDLGLTGTKGVVRKWGLRCLHHIGGWREPPFVPHVGDSTPGTENYHH